MARKRLKVSEVVAGLSFGRVVDIEGVDWFDMVDFPIGDVVGPIHFSLEERFEVGSEVWD